MTSPYHWEDDSFSVDNDSLPSGCSHSLTQGSVSQQQEPIVVGYAFGPKKMSTMGVVMAEASRAEVIHEEKEEELLFYGDEDEDHDDEGPTTRSDRLTPVPTRRPSQSASEETPAPVTTTGGVAFESSPSVIKKTASSLTTDALEGLEADSKQANSTIISLGNSNDTNLKHIVRYFRSSCSTAATSMSETTVSTPTTLASRHTRSKRFPVRIAFVPLDPDLPLQEQHGGHFDLILHKLTEDILTCSLKQGQHPHHDAHKEQEEEEEDYGDAPWWRRIQTIKDYPVSINPNCCLVDDPSNVQTLMSRSDISHVLETCLQGVTSSSGIPVKAPRFVVVHKEPNESKVNWNDRLTLGSSSDDDDNDKSHHVDDTCHAQKLSVPLIAKPLIAAGTKHSHHMTIVLQESGLDRLLKVDDGQVPQNQRPPAQQHSLLLQEYVNHNATLYKVYVLGDHVFVYQRPSLPDLPHPLPETTLDLVEFDSQRPYPRLSDLGMTMASTATSSSLSTSKPSSSTAAAVTSDEVRPIVQVLKRAFGLELFGFDILVHNSVQPETSSSSTSLTTPTWLVVDVNYFPSYKEVPNFPVLLAQYLTQRVLEQRRKTMVDAVR